MRGLRARRLPDPGKSSRSASKCSPGRGLGDREVGAARLSPPPLSVRLAPSRSPSPVAARTAVRRGPATTAALGATAGRAALATALGVGRAVTEALVRRDSMVFGGGVL